MKPASSGYSIAILSPGELFGGVEKHVLDLCVSLQGTGYTTLPILFHDRELAMRLRESGLGPVILRTRHRYDPQAARQLADLLSGRGIDVLHLHGYRASITAALARPRPGLGIVKTEHGQVEPGGSSPARVKSHLHRFLEDRAIRRLDARVCYVTSDLMRDFEKTHRGLERRVIHNGIMPVLRDRRPRPAAMRDGRFHAGIVGRIAAVKGIRFALEAMSTDLVPPHVHLNVIGSGPEEERLRRHVVDHELKDRVTFHGFQREVLDWLAHLDALLMPSLHEGLPYTLLEGMSLGIPIVASRVGGLLEVVRHGSTGLLVEVADVRSLARSLADLARNPELCARLGNAAAEEQRSLYTLDRMAGQYLETYAQARGREGPAPQPSPEVFERCSHQG